MVVRQVGLAGEKFYRNYPSVEHNLAFYTGLFFSSKGNFLDRRQETALDDKTCNL